MCSSLSAAGLRLKTVNMATNNDITSMIAVYRLKETAALITTIVEGYAKVPPQPRTPATRKETTVND